MNVHSIPKQEEVELHLNGVSLCLTSTYAVKNNLLPFLS